MGFLLKHYEKILLAVLLTVFIGLLAFQVVLWRQNEQIQVEKLKGFKDPPPNYQAVKFGDEKSPFRVLETLSAKPSFNKAQPRERNTARIDSQILFTDLMVPYPMALCPYCNRVIPATAFPAGDGESKCPLDDCRKTLHAPFNVTSEKEQDTDGDGIPDKDERLLGLNPNNPDDANFDSDGDEYTNYQEFVCKTNYKDPKSRPPYHEKMQVMPIKRRKLLFQLKKITFRDKTKKDTAEIEMSIEKPDKRVRFQTVPVKLNQVFPKPRLGDSRNLQRYIVVDVIPKFVSSGSSEINESKVVVRKCRILNPNQPESKWNIKEDGDRITAELGREVFEPRIRADLILGSKSFEIYAGDEISYGSINTGKDVYTVTEINEKKNTVTLKYSNKGDNQALRGKNFIIEQVSMLQKKMDAAKAAHQPRRGKRRPAPDSQK